MELKRLITKYVYRIEPKPAGGGFVARAIDTSIPPLEASTRAELQQRIQAAVMAGLATDFPGLKLPPQSGEMKFAFHVERNANGTFDIHSSDPGAAPIQALTHDEIESHFAEKLIGFVGKHLSPEFAQALAAQGATGGIKVFVKKTGFTVTAGGNQAQIGPAALSSAAGPAASDVKPEDTRIEEIPIEKAPIFGAKILNPTSSTNQSTFDDGPITRTPITPSSGGTLVRFLIALLIIAAVIWFIFLRHQ